jgi:hypothetical protein
MNTMGIGRTPAVIMSPAITITQSGYGSFSVLPWKVNITSDLRTLNAEVCGGKHRGGRRKLRRKEEAEEEEEASF